RLLGQRRSARLSPSLPPRGGRWRASAPDGGPHCGWEVRTKTSPVSVAPAGLAAARPPPPPPRRHLLPPGGEGAKSRYPEFPFDHQRVAVEVAKVDVVLADHRPGLEARAHIILATRPIRVRPDAVAGLQASVVEVGRPPRARRETRHFEADNGGGRVVLDR